MVHFAGVTAAKSNKLTRTSGGHKTAFSGAKWRLKSIAAFWAASMLRTMTAVHANARQAVLSQDCPIDATCDAARSIAAQIRRARQPIDSGRKRSAD